MQLQEAHLRVKIPCQGANRRTPGVRDHQLLPSLISNFSPPCDTNRLISEFPTSATKVQVPSWRESPSQRSRHTGIPLLVRTAACVSLVSPAYFTPHMTNEQSCHQSLDIPLHTCFKPSSSCCQTFIYRLSPDYLRLPSTGELFFCNSFFVHATTIPYLELRYILWYSVLLWYVAARSASLCR